MDLPAGKKGSRLRKGVLGTWTFETRTKFLVIVEVTSPDNMSGYRRT